MTSFSLSIQFNSNLYASHRQTSSSSSHDWTRLFVDTKRWLFLRWILMSVLITFTGVSISSLMDIYSIHNEQKKCQKKTSRNKKKRKYKFPSSGDIISSFSLRKYIINRFLVLHFSSHLDDSLVENNSVSNVIFFYFSFRRHSTTSTLLPINFNIFHLMFRQFYERKMKNASTPSENTRHGVFIYF